MKNILKNTVVAAVMFVTITSMASEPKITLAHGTNAKSLVLEFDAQSKESKIKLTDENAKTIYYENTIDSNYVKKFNLEDLENGLYDLTVENALFSIFYTLDVSKKGVEIVNKVERKFLPIFRKIGTKVDVNLFNADQQKVTFEIVDSRGNSIFKEFVKNELSIGKTFNFKNAIKETYTIIVDDGEKTYYQNIVIE